MTTTVTDLVLQVVSDKANLLDSFVSLYATFVGALHRIIGIEFGQSPLTIRFSTLSDADMSQGHTSYTP